MSKDIIAPGMDFVNETWKQAKKATFKQLCIFAVLIVLKTASLLAIFGGFIWLLRNI